MDLFLARQPVFDRSLRVFGYELLYRSAAAKGFDGSDGTVATQTVVANSIFNFGLEKVLSGKTGFLNFTRALLVDDYVTTLPSRDFVIEVLESVEPDAEVVAACRRLNHLGYRLALDDVVPGSPHLALAEFAGMLKVDFRATSESDQLALVHEFRPRGISMLAEKVETRAEFDRALSMGYSYFQGYFLDRPTLLAGHGLRGSRARYFAPDG